MVSAPRQVRVRLPAHPAERAWWSVASVLAACAAVVLVVGLLPDGTTAPMQPWRTANAAGAVAGLSLGPSLEAALSFEPEVIADIAGYRGPRRSVALVARILAVLVPLLVAVGLAGSRGERILRPLRRMRGVAWPVGVVVGATVVLTAVVRLPLSVWAGVVQDGAWGFRTRSVAGWSFDLLAVVAGRALLLTLLAAGVVTIVRRHPATWPARLTVLAAVVGPLMLLLHPLVVHPLLLPTGPLPDGPHRDAVVAVVARSGTDVPVLLGEASRRTTRRNAVATGLGPTRRIVLHDTLLELSPREVAAITAHELAHLERGDALRGVVAPVPIVLLAGIAARRRLARRRGPHPAEPCAGPCAGPPVPSLASPLAPPDAQVRALAVVAVLILALEAATAPLTAAVSRTVEHRTDVRAVALSGDVEAYVAMLRSFVIDGLAEPDPPRWSVLLWASHPAPATRIAAALDVAERLSGTVDPATR